ncbi:MAG: methionine synthase [Gammaproteobacteria bacterium]|nr:methionine synthase [Gammaproteobacteria bacterium]
MTTYPPLKLSGLEHFEIDRSSLFVNIGERTNVTGSKVFAQNIINGDYDSALKIARQQIENGAQLIDINMDEAMLDGPKVMTDFLNLIASEPDIAKVPIVIDSSNWQIIEAGLRCVQGKSIVNSISLKEGEVAFLHQAKLVRRYGAACIVMAFDEAGQADSYHRKIEICQRAYTILTQEIDFPPEDIIFDPNIFAIATGIEEHKNYALDYIKAITWIKENLPGTKVSGGISNVSFSFRGNNHFRELIHSVFLFHAIKAGLDMGIVNAGPLISYESIRQDLRDAIEAVIFNRSDDAVETLLGLAQTYQSEKSVQPTLLNWRFNHQELLPNPQRLAYALVHGISDFIEEDIHEALTLAEQENRSALSIIETDLMAGMSQVGDLFAEGKLFLPQVVKSARVMKLAVHFLMPALEKERSNQNAFQGKILLATVKGDVHDIGKNIVAVVLQCNNFEIINMGVMVPAHQIIQTALQEQVDMIGLSGLITPSLAEMEYVAKEMSNTPWIESRKIPLLIGGATTSKVHTAVKIAPHYTGPTVYVADASRAVGVAQKLMSSLKQDFIDEVVSEQARLKNLHAQKVTHLISYEEAKKRRLVIDWTQYTPPKPKFLGNRTLNNLDLATIAKYIDWGPFFQTWDLHGNFPKILQDPLVGEQAQKVYQDAQAMLDRIIHYKWLSLKAIVGFYGANSQEEDIIIWHDAKRQNPAFVWYGLRQQIPKPALNPNLCLSDFIAPIGYQDYIGMFALTAGDATSSILREFEAQHNDYDIILFKSLSDRLAEALAEYLHERVRKDFWGYAKEENSSLADLIQEKYQGIRPAPGYPSCPDHQVKEAMFTQLDGTAIGLSLTENLAMSPASSICGFYFSHPQSKYFNVGKIGEDQLRKLAHKQGSTQEKTAFWLPNNL